MKRARILILLLVVMAMVAAACDSDDGDDTTTTAAADGETTTTAAQETTTTAAEATTTVAPAEPGTISFWSTETTAERLEITQGIIDEFTALTGIKVQLVPVNQDSLPQVMLTNAASGTLPDVVFHPLDLTVGWAEAGILDLEATAEVIDNLGVETFADGPLALANVGGTPSAVPVDGWGQLLIYRTDLFEAAGLDTPDTFEKITAAAEALNDPGSNLFGITASNDPGGSFTQQTFEHIALANGCNLVDSSGTVTLNSSNCVEAIDFYENLLNNYSPAGLQDVVSTRATYFAGQAAMIIWSPFIMDEMAGLRDAALPTCPECADNIAYLAENSALIGSFSGPSGAPAQYGSVNYMGIGVTDNTDASKQFIEYWLSEGYLDWLSTSVEGKLPMRQGTQDDPTFYIDGWLQLQTGVDRKAPLSDFYTQEVINGLIEGTNNFARWGFNEGEGALVGALVQTLLVPATLDEVLAGSLSAEEGAQQMQELAEEEQSFLE